MEQLVTSDFKLGIIGGGQLGKMLTQAASSWDVKTYIFDPDENCPCSTICSKYVNGKFQDFEDVYDFGKSVDVLTYELENVNVDALIKLKQEGLKVYPDPEALKIIQDKGLQKAYYQKNNIPTSNYHVFDDKRGVIAAIENETVTIPFVQKLRIGGYDGQGVSVIQSNDDLDTLLEGACVIEQLVDIEKELAVIVVRNEAGEMKCFPTVEMTFNDEANLVEKLISPANIFNSIREEAKELACKISLGMDIVGTLAVELFLDKQGKLWVNEVAPRPHNSGHHTIESVITSQYEQHLRAVLGIPLGSTQIKLPAVMVNILGEPGFRGKVKYEGLKEAMAIEGVKIHIYGKKHTRPYRKMGHATVLGDTIFDAIEKADQVIECIKVKSWE